MNNEGASESGKQGQKDFALQGFTEVAVSTAIQFEITQAPEYSVKAVGSDRLLKRLKVEVSGQTLKAGLDTGFSFLPGVRCNGNVKVVVTMPVLRKLKASGACKGTAKGFKSGDELDLELSGASQADIDIEAGKTAVEVSGAGRLAGVLKAQETEIELSGASRCELSGTGGATKLDFSGASRADLSRFQVQDADIDLSGASQASVNMDGKLNADLSGASRLEYTGNVTLGKTSSTGASRLHGND